VVFISAFMGFRPLEMVSAAVADRAMAAKWRTRAGKSRKSGTFASGKIIPYPSAVTQSA
jgi:hypothetical protein